MATVPLELRNAATDAAIAHSGKTSLCSHQITSLYKTTLGHFASEVCPQLFVSMKCFNTAQSETEKFALQNSKLYCDCETVLNSPASGLLCIETIEQFVKICRNIVTIVEQLVNLQLVIRFLLDSHIDFLGTT